jgi:hypothetical protein
MNVIESKCKTRFCATALFSPFLYSKKNFLGKFHVSAVCVSTPKFGNLATGMLMSVMVKNYEAHG